MTETNDSKVEFETLGKAKFVKGSSSFYIDRQKPVDSDREFYMIRKYKNDKKQLLTATPDEVPELVQAIQSLSTKK